MPLPLAFISFLTPKVLLTLGVVAVLSFVGWKTYSSGYTNGSAMIQIRFDQYILVHQEAAMEAKITAEARERVLTSEIVRIERVAKNEKSGIIGRYESALAELRERPERPDPRGNIGVSETATSPTGCSGAGLAKGDAEFLAGYSADAAKLKSALQQCLSVYSSTRDLVK